MKDWKALAQASLEIPAPEIDRVAGPLASLDASFRPLVRDLTPDMEPATTFDAGEESI